MKKGLIFIIIISAIFWGIYYTENGGKKEKTKDYTDKKLKAPVEKADQVVHKANLNILETTIKIFNEREKRFPTGLDELVEKGYLSKIPDPGPDSWKYNPSTGEVM